LFAEIEKRIEALKVKASLHANNDLERLTILRLEEAILTLEARNEENEKHILELAEKDD